MPITTFGEERMERNLNAQRGRRISIVNSDPAARVSDEDMVKSCCVYLQVLHLQLQQERYAW